jgi:hypothetical protein
MDNQKTKAAPPTKENAASQNNQHAQFTLPLSPASTKPRTKHGTILAVLGTRSLNRFEAEPYGDHCLHSTISTLKDQGHVIHDEWESVPTRFGTIARVKRYRLVRRAS